MFSNNALSCRLKLIRKNDQVTEYFHNAQTSADGLQKINKWNNKNKMTGWKNSKTNSGCK